jgi:hypothetical protein
MLPHRQQVFSRAAVIPFYIIAALAFFLTTALCLFAADVFVGHFFQPKVLALTHLFVLGCGVMIIFGASNQLIPVISERKLYNERVLPVLVLVLLTVGVALLVYSFWNFLFTWHTFTGVACILTAILLHSLNLYSALKKAEERAMLSLIKTAHVWLIFTAVIGSMLLINFRFPFLSVNHLQYLKVHANIGMVGWFLQLIVGVSSKLIPMFLLCEEPKEKQVFRIYYGINSGLVLFMINQVFFHSQLVNILAVLMIIVAIFFYGRYVYSSYLHSIRKQLDNGMKQTRLSFALLVLPCMLLLPLFVVGDMPANFSLAYGFSFFGGFVGTIVMAQTFKTLPFIVWMQSVDENELPAKMPKDFFNEKLVRVQMLLYIAGLLPFVAGIVLKYADLCYAGAALMAVATSIYFIHVLLIVRKKFANV